MRAAAPFALAGALTVAGMAAAADLSDVVLAATGDWNGDGVTDAAVLMMPRDGADLLGLALFLADPRSGRLGLVETWDDAVWGAYAMAGQEPGLAPLPGGSLAVTSRNESIGRNRWTQRLTLAWRDGAFRVAGFTYVAYDTLEPRAAGPLTCDLNLFTGQGTVDGAAIRFQPARPTLREWDETAALRICGVL